MDQSLESFKKADYEYLTVLIEDTFDMCETNKEELYWLVCLVRGLMNCPNQRVSGDKIQNMKINYWQNMLDPFIRKYKRKFHHGS